MYSRIETHLQMKTTTVVDISIKLNKRLVRDLVKSPLSFSSDPQGWLQ